MKKSRFEIRVEEQIYRDLKMGRNFNLSPVDHYKQAELQSAHFLVDPYGTPEDALQAITEWNNDKRFYDGLPFMGFDGFGTIVTPKELKDAIKILAHNLVKISDKKG